MSHFVGLCFGDFWEDNLEQYYEGLKVEEEIVYTKEEAIAQAKKDHMYSYNTAVEALKDSKGLSENMIQIYNNIISKGETITDKEAWEEAQDWGYLIDDEGNLLSSYNPASHWDWYTIGGRWSGFLILKELDDFGNHLTTSQANISEIDWECMLKENNYPFCFVNENGEWYEKAEMGWWGVTYNENDDYNESFENYIKSLIKDCDEDCLVTVVDFHI